MSLISVILPVYRAEKYIAKCMESVLRQTYDEFEFIIVVNGSDPGTIQKIESFKDKRIRLLHMEKPDLVGAINKAIVHSNGKYISRIDADDWMPAERLEIQKKFLGENKSFDVVSGKVVYEGDTDKYHGYYLHVEWLNNLNNYNEMYTNRFVDMPLANSSLMMKKSVFDNYGLYKTGNLPEDYEIVLRWFENGIKIGKADEYVLHWRDHSERLTRNDPRYSQAAFYKIKAEYFARWYENQPYQKDGILIWGTGKSVREKSHYLAENDIQIGGFIDVKKNSKMNDVPVYHYQSIPENHFILSYVSDRKGRIEIYRYLAEHGYRPGVDFYMMS